MESYEKKLSELEKRIAALEEQLIIPPPVDISTIKKKAQIMREAHATGSRSEIIRATKLINGQL